MTKLGRREFAAFWLWPVFSSSPKAAANIKIVVSVNVMFDQAVNSTKGLTASQIALFRSYQERAAQEFAISGIRFDLRYTEGAYMREQGFAEIPDRFLVPRTINLFVTESLGYDIDHDRTGGCSIGPRPRMPRRAPDPFYKTFLGLKDARATTLPHEYAHHFVLDTQHSATIAGNFWADMRNDYWLWRQRHGVAVREFQACVNSEWAKVES